MTDSVQFDPATQFVHDCMRARLRPEDAAIVHTYCEDVFRQGRRDHVVRAMETLRLLSNKKLLTPQTRLAETGDLGEVGLTLRNAGYDCQGVEGDLRKQMQMPDASLDLLLSLEVFEHLQDIPPDHWRETAIFHGNGAQAFAKECGRLVKPGGHLLLTTPNATSLFSLIQLAEGQAPMLWRQHVREYTMAEVTTHFEAAGFVLEHIETWFAYHFLHPHDIESLENRYLKPLGASCEHRGDDAAYIFRRLGAPASPIPAE